MESIAGVIVTSGEAALSILSNPQLKRLQDKPWVVVSERVAKLVRESGVDSVHISAGASDPALLKCVHQIME